MAGRPVSKNNVIAGSFLVVGLILAIVVSAILADAQERLIPSREYIVRFTVAEGAAGLKPGSKVTLGGLGVGRVMDLELSPAPGQPSLDARVRVRTGVTLYENAVVFLESPLLGSGSTVNISSIGEHKDGAPHAGASDTLEPGEVISGHIAPPAFLAQAGYGPEQANKVRVAIDQVADLTERLDGIVKRIEPKIDPTIDSVRAAVDDLQAITTDIRQHGPEWAGKGDRLLPSADEAAATASPLI